MVWIEVEGKRIGKDSVSFTFFTYSRQNIMKRRLSWSHRVLVLFLVIFPIHFQWLAIFDKCDFVQFCTK